MPRPPMELDRPSSDAAGESPLHTRLPPMVLASISGDVWLPLTLTRPPMWLKASSNPPALFDNVTVPSIVLAAHPSSTGSPTSTKPLAPLTLKLPPICEPQIVTRAAPPLDVIVPRAVELTIESLAPAGTVMLRTSAFVRHVLPDDAVTEVWLPVM